MKDRYNLNLLIDEEGYIIYIDFGYMFFNFFGGVNFESVFFKFICEFFEVIFEIKFLGVLYSICLCIISD